MKESELIDYLFYYNEISEDKTNGNGSFIWYSLQSCKTILEAILMFKEYVGDESQIIQIIVKNKLH